MAPPPSVKKIFGNYDILLDTVFSKYDVAHELGHVWDYRTDYQLSEGLLNALGTLGTVTERPIYASFGNTPTIIGSVLDWDPLCMPLMEPAPGTPLSCTILGGTILDPAKQNDPACRPYALKQGDRGLIVALFTPPGAEDWAESFASYVDGYYHLNKRQPEVGLVANGIRYNYVKQRIENLP